MMDEGTQGPEAGEGPSKARSRMGIGCLLVLLVLGGCMILAYGPGFVSYRREQNFHRRVHQVAESIRTALADYAEHHLERRYPDNIRNYQALHDLVNKHGGSLPESSFDADIAQISYTSDDGSDYELIITLDVPDNVRKGKFQRVTPEGVTRAVTASFGADKTLQPKTSVERLETAPAKTMQQEKKMMAAKTTCPGPDPAAGIGVQIVSQDADGLGGTVRIRGRVVNIRGATYKSGPGQQSVQLWEDVPGVDERQPVVKKDFQVLGRRQMVSIEVEREWRVSTEFPPSYEVRIEYDPDILSDENENNDDCNMNNNREKLEAKQINARFKR
ncbi:MAG: hypothetical protein JRF64_01980 [Deltaproteobacteria bacterium]|nr:hypothetical protein [Deltaproteobacteria bacterium]MBW2565714.1 hypothetical protein [Deltaproteobacteria bacterium]